MIRKHSKASGCVLWFAVTLRVRGTAGGSEARIHGLEADP